MSTKALHTEVSSRPESEARSGETPVFAEASAGGTSPDTDAAVPVFSQSEEPLLEGLPDAPFALAAPLVAPEPKPAKEKKQPEEVSQSPFVITVGQVYDGPFDLLLDLIRRQNIDIYDIPIAKITAQFLEYTRHLQQTDVDSAGEFVYTASLLIHIKSKTLLPRDPLAVNAGADEDPRRELVERLLEHERFKAAAQMLLQKQQVEDATWSHPGMKSFLRERPVHEISEDSVTVAQMIDFVKRRLLMEDKPVSLRRMLHNAASERALICTFLALLELVRLQAVLLRQPEQMGDILIKKTDEFEQVMSETAQVRDDWD